MCAIVINMSERKLFTTAFADFRNPELSLAKVVSQRVRGALLLPETPVGISSPPTVSLIVDPDYQEGVQKMWKAVTDTMDFTCLQKAFEGDTEFFGDTAISSEDLIFPASQAEYFSFYDFCRSWCYIRAKEYAELREEYGKIIDLKLEARSVWVPRLGSIQKGLAGPYVSSIVGRIYNLITTGEEKPNLKDRTLDLVMRMHFLP